MRSLHLFLVRSVAFLAAVVAVALAPATASAALPPGCVLLEYIESTGTQYVDTGVTVTPAMAVEADVQLTEKVNSRRVFGNTRDASSIYMSFGVYVNGNGRWASAMQNSSAGWVDSGVTADATTRHVHKLDCTTRQYYLDGTAKGSAHSAVTQSTQGSIYLFADHYQGGSAALYTKMKLYGCTIVSNGTPVRCFVPARLNGEIGLCDTLSRTFYGNAGTGVFTAGPDIETPSEWITVDGVPAQYGSPTPGYGDYTNVTVGATVEFTCPAVFTNAAADVITTCRGYRHTLTNGTSSGGSGTSVSFAYSADMACSTLAWQWDVQYKVTLKTRIAVTETTIGTRWTDAMGCVTVKAPTAAAGYQFVRWEGDGLSGADPSNPTVTAELTAPGTLTAVYRVAPTHVWTGAASTDFATADNWTDAGGAATTAPDADSVVYIPGGVARAPTASAPFSVAALHVGSANGEGGTVTLTFETADTCEVAGDFNVYSGGTVTHKAHAGGTNVYGLDLTVGGGVLLETGASVNLDKKGLLSSGPGYDSTNKEAGHGGSSPNRNGKCHDSLLQPTSCGTGNNGYFGGGRMKVVVAGAVTLNGTVTAKGQNGGGWEAAAGGSVWMTTGTLTGTGSIDVSGGNGGSNWPRSGGGGRVALYQTTATDFSAWHGTVKAYGGVNSSKAAGAGTIYLQAAGETVTNSVTIVDNGGRVSYGYTDFSAATSSDVVGTLVVTNGALLRVPNGETLSVYGSFFGRTGLGFTESTNACVAFCGPAVARIEGDAVFPSVTCAEPGKSFVFGTGASDLFGIADTCRITLTGAAGNPISLAGEGGGTWKMKLGGAVVQELRNLSVSGSDASVGIGVFALDSAAGAVANVNWSMMDAPAAGAEVTWTGSGGTDWRDPSNWTPKRAPLTSDCVRVAASAAASPVLRANDAAIASLTVEAGKSLTLQGANLTVTGNVTNKGVFVFSGTERLTLLGDATFAGGSVTAASSEILLTGDAMQRVDLAGLTLYDVVARKTGGRVALQNGFTARHVLDFRYSGGVEFVFAAGETVAAEETYFADVTLVSSVPGTKWLLDSPNVSVSHITVSDSKSVGRTVYADVNSREGIADSNVNWLFGSLSQTWTGGKGDGKWESAGNWDPAVVPGPTSRVTVVTAGTITSSTFAEAQNLVVGDGAKATVLVIRGGLAVGDGVDVRNAATLTADKPIAVTNGVRVRAGGKITHTAQTGNTNVYGVDLTVGGDFVLESGASVNLDKKGYASGGPGAYSAEKLTGHGGSPPKRIAGWNFCHDSLLCPTNCGTSSSAIGGGRMKLFAAGTVTLDGAVSALGGMAGGWEGASGGSVWISAGTLTGTGSIDVTGGSGSSYWERSGAGGRVALYLSVARDFSAWHGTVKAYGGVNSAQAAGAGTIYFQAAGETVTNSLTIVDNGGRPSVGYTDFSAATSSDVVGTLVVTNGALLRVPNGETLSVYGSFLGRTGLGFTESTDACVAFCGPATAHLEGSNAFPNVTCTVPGKTLVFGTAADSFTVGDGTTAHKLTLRGTEEKPVVLLSDESDGVGRTWSIDMRPSAVTDILYASVSNSVAVGRAVTAIDSNDLGGNTGWTFSSPIVPGEQVEWTGSAEDGNWANKENWRSAKGVRRLPEPTDRVVIPSSAHPPKITDGTLSLNALEIRTGGALTLDGCTMTVTNDLTVAGTLTALGTETIVCSNAVSFSGGTFVPARSTFRLVGDLAQTVSLAADQTFHRFEIRKDAGGVTFDAGFAAHVCDWLTENAVTLQFAAGATAAADEFFCRGRQGTAATTASLTLTGTGAWNVRVGTEGFFSGLSVKNAHATGLPCPADVRSVDASGNAGWDFTAKAAEWTGAAGDTKWETAGNWYPSAVPDADTHVLVAPRPGEPGTVKVASGGASVSNLFTSATGWGGGTVSFSATGPLAVAGDWFTGTNATVVLNSPLVDNTVAGSAYFRSGAVLTHDQADETCKFNLTAAGDVILEQGVNVDVSKKGAAAGQGYYVKDSLRLSAHAGTTPEAFEMDLCYGSAFAPTNSGSGNQGLPGGGVVKIRAGGELRLDGKILSDGGPVSGIEGSSGGSVWLTAARLTGSGSVQANGGDNGIRGGGGGRVAVWTTAADGLADWHGTLQARGGKTTGGAGTVYVQTAEGTRSLRMDNTGRESSLTTGSCELFDGGYSHRFWRTVSVVATNKATLVLRTDLSLRDLDLQSTNLKLYLRGHTLTIYSAKHKDGRKWADTIDNLVVPGDGGQIIWKSTGTVLMVR